MGNEYRTSDLYEASALVTQGIELVRIDPPPWGRRYEFIFRESSELEKIVNEFTNGKLWVNARIFLSTWRQLRREIDKAEGRMRDGKRSIY